MSAKRPRFSSAHLIALLALFVALGGTVYAATRINGKVIVKGSIPANRLKRDSLTGTQVNESSLGTVPAALKATEAARATEAVKATEAARALQATKAVEASKAGEAVKATEATKAVEAGKAGEAAKAAQATKATEAAKATEANSAQQAGNALALGGEPASSYQHACQVGTIKGVVRVNENGGNPQTTTAYNCSGGPITVERKGAGKFEVDFVGLDNLLSATASTIGENCVVAVEGEGAGSFLVVVTRGGAALDSTQFTVVVF